MLWTLFFSERDVICGRPRTAKIKLVIWSRLTTANCANITMATAALGHIWLAAQRNYNAHKYALLQEYRSLLTSNWLHPKSVVLNRFRWYSCLLDANNKRHFTIMHNALLFRRSVCRKWGRIGAEAAEQVATQNSGWVWHNALKLFEVLTSSWIVDLALWLHHGAPPLCNRMLWQRPWLHVK